ncbi:hypothetical protein CGMCC3_g11748 [Colletotrichum fructicola]|nr:uncharacterized protein CGMCC3_g11748 [Colletotrichum fructicola]KAE9572319.1 hypothetical protein CGMCC3_g11748 [Colletotrichum fructicola]
MTLGNTSKRQRPSSRSRKSPPRPYLEATTTAQIASPESG